MAELQPWIDRRVAEVDAARARGAGRGDAIPYLGGRCGSCRSRGAGARTARRRAAGAGGRPGAIERWLRRAARERSRPRAHRAAAALGVDVARVTIRDPRTRWGSCSSSGSLSFSWRLVLAPEEVLDYVVWHEVCHLREMNHSPRYWALVARHCPGYEEPRRWLRRNATALRVALSS